MPSRVLITGANGFLGLSLLRPLSSSRAIVAALRSEGAAAAVRAESERLGIACKIRRTPDYRRPAWGTLLGGVDAVVHSVGILRESATSHYKDAHEDSVSGLVATAPRSCRLIYVSLVGADAASQNECLASKGRAEAILLRDRPDALVLRLPMILGGRDPSSHALRAQAIRRIVPLLDGGEAIDQPIDVRDVGIAIERALVTPTLCGALDLVGPETLSYRALLMRCAALWGNKPRVLPIPATLARAAARFLAHLSANPAVTETMLDILLRNDRRDASVATAALALTLRPLDSTLETFIGPDDATPTETSD